MKLIKTEDEQGVMYSLSGDNLPENYVLSKENCDEIFGVVDVEKLANDYFKSTNENAVLWRRIDFKVGFNKAMELNKDKVFTLEDMREAIAEAWNSCEDNEDEETFTQCFNRIIQSLQQPTEIEVEIVEQCLDPTCDGINRKGECVTTGKPKYDTDGCLILKIK